VLAARSYPVKILLVGRQEILRRELAEHLTDHLPIEIVNANEIITMDDAAAKAVRAKKDSSVRVAARLVRQGRAQGMVSAGNTGAIMATAKIVMGTLSGVYRPALASVFPTLKGTAAVLIDVGANVDSTPAMLTQFALMGEVYSRLICRMDRPRVGLLSIGEEEHKGNELTKGATPLLKQLPINYIGNVEGRDVYSGQADVIVCDGFIGNVALKVSEGLVETIKYIIQESLTATVTRKIGYVLSRAAFDDFKKRLDYSEYGGAPLLGVKGVCIICHGRSNPNAIKNAIRVAFEFSEGRVNEEIETALVAHRAELGKVTAIGD
jgi:glycerol-3-phosphate acyltransferase PlsX